MAPVGTILERIARGDASAVEACLDEYGGMVWGLADRYLRAAGGDVEDAVQEIFVEVWKHADRFDADQGSEAAFIATIAHRRLIDRQRRAASRGGIHLQTEAPPEPGAPVGDPPNQPEDIRRALSAFRQIDEEDRRVLWLSIYQGMSHERIARALDQPLGTIKHRIRRGLGMLRALVAAGDERGVER